MFQVEDYVRPTSETTDAVTGWLADSGIEAKAISAAGDWLEFSLTVAQASDLLDADFRAYSFKGSDQRIIRTMAYSIPVDLKGHLALLHPTVRYATSMHSVI